MQNIYDVVKELDTIHLQRFTAWYEADPDSGDRREGRFCAVDVMLGGDYNLWVSQFSFDLPDRAMTTLGKVEVIYEGWIDLAGCTDILEPIPYTYTNWDDERMQRKHVVYQACVEELTRRTSAPQQEEVELAEA